MTDSTPGRARTSVPWGLLGAVALIVVVEWGAVRGRLDFVSEVGLVWRHTGRIVPREATENDLLCLGDSMLKYGVQPWVLEAETGRPSYNLGVFASSTPVSYFLLRRALEAGARPSAVVFNCSQAYLGCGPANQAVPYPWSELLTAGEALELARATRAPTLVARVLLSECLPSLRGRFEVRACLRGCLAGTPDEMAFTHRALLTHLARNRGAVLYPANAGPDESPPAKGTAPLYQDWRPDPVNAAYLVKLIELAEAHRVRLFWVLMPTTPGRLASSEGMGLEPCYTRFARVVQARFPKLVVIDGRHMGINRARFIDSVHLGSGGAIALSHALGRVVREELSAPATGSRWVDLPRASIPPSDEGLERFDQTVTALRFEAARARR